jgi:hypothetical protein
MGDAEHVHIKSLAKKMGLGPRGEIL